VSQSPVDRHTRDRVTYFVLNNPRELNGITEHTMEELENVCAEIEGSHSVRALVIIGVEDVFCVGLHLRVLDRAFRDHAYFRSVLDRFNAVLFRLGTLPVPVIAAVNGTCRAGGFELMLAADLVLAASEAHIGDVHTPFGVMPGGGSTQRLPRAVGMQRAMEIILSGRWLDGTEAAAIGLALGSVPRAGLAEAVESLVASLRPQSRRCLAEVKAVMRAGEAMDLRSAVNLETKSFMKYLEESRDATEGFTAYREARAPRWES
jgi:enoyl-CoA hydratase/carnithine racemase